MTGAKKRMFLRWLLINMLTTVTVVAAGIAFADKVRGASLVAIPIILGIAAAASGYGGLISWRADEGGVKNPPHRLMHEAQYLIFSAWACQMIGILSTIAGFWIILSKGTGADDFAVRVQSGAAVALLGSFVGVLSSLVLMLIHRLLEHELEG